jgi:hypothetical protein
MAAGTWSSRCRQNWARVGKSGRLLAGREREWAGQAADLVPLTDIAFHRGFVEDVRLTLGGVPAGLERLFAVAPIQAVRFQGPNGYLSGLAFTYGWDRFAASR